MDVSSHEIVAQVYQAKKDSRAADAFIASYLPFIKSETAKFLNRPPDPNDDELSIAMFAFYEAICKYSRLRGSFLKFAALQIKNRLIDNYRREQRNRGNLSLDSSDDEQNELLERIEDKQNTYEEHEIRDAAKQEIDGLTAQMQEFGVSMQDVSENSPRQQRTLEICQKAVLYAKGNSEILEEFLRTKRVPLAKIAEGAGVERKTLERHRRYLVAALLICVNDYEILWSHVAQVLQRGGAA